MDKKTVNFFFLRHWLRGIWVLLALGFVGGSVFVMLKASALSNAATQAYDEVNSKRDTIQGSKVKVDIKNVGVLGQVADEYKSFTDGAGEIFEVDPLASMTSNDYLNYMVESISLLNRKAFQNLVTIPNDLTRRRDLNYSFTFGSLLDQADIAEDKIPELQVQLENIKEITGVLLHSRIQSIDWIQRSRVTTEDFKAGASSSYLDNRKMYSNSVGVVRPYRVQFQCLSDGIAIVLSEFAKKKTFFVVRSLNVTPGSGAITLSSSVDESMSGDEEMDGGGGDEEMDGGGGDDGGAESTTSTFQVSKLPLPYINYLVSQGLAPPPATNVIGETLLQVKLDLDIINRAMVPQNVVPEEGAPSE